MRLYDWVYLITVANPNAPVGSDNAIEFSNLNDPRGVGPRLQFEIKRGLAKEPNTCKITISNLATATRVELDRNPLIVTVAAGYRDSGPRLMFAGDVRRSYSDLKGTDYETVIQLRDGGRAFDFGRINRSYKAGVTVLKVLQDLAASMSLTLPAEVTNASVFKQSLPTGITFAGPTRDALTRVLAPFGYNWSIQNTRLQILQDGQAKPGSAFLINQGSGLIGTPQRSTPDKPKGKSELTLDTLLYPELFPGALTKLESATFDGVFRIKELTHKGDTHGDDWKTTLRCA